MNGTVQEVLDFVRENDVQFIRLAFCDPFGTPKTISIMPDELPLAFAQGISFDAYAIKGFCDVTKSDLMLVPDPTTLTVLPWRPGPGRVAMFYCEVKKPDETPFAGDSRFILKRVLQRCEDLGYVCKIGAECEFYLFKTDEFAEPTLITHDHGGYLDVAPLDKGENIRREICLCLAEMGIMPETAHHEQGPGQNEIDFKFGDALACADNFLTFKMVVKTVAARNGLFASFMPKPLLKKSGSGLHVNLSLSKNGQNIFKTSPESHSRPAESFMAGILEKTPEMTLFLNPLANSYERFGQFEAPKYVSWSHQNRSQLIRIPAAKGERQRMELRSPDPSTNPYLAFALIISAGLEGIKKDLPLCPPADFDLYHASEEVTSKLQRMPADMGEALALAQGSLFVRDVLGVDLMRKFISQKTEEFERLKAADDKEEFYFHHYFKST